MIPIAFLWALLAFDWDEVLMVCTGLAAATVVYLDRREYRTTHDVLRDHAERLSRLEANSDDSVALEVRLTTIEAQVGVSERQEERLSSTNERVARIETWLEIDEQ